MNCIENPRVSILMPVRNEERYLSAALRSITAQTLQDWELIIVDDGSTDVTPAILVEAAQYDKRIKVITGKGDGLATALNRGLQACSAPLLARMDGDDISHPARFEQQVRFLDSNPNIDLVACSFKHFPRTGLKNGMLLYEQWQNGLTSHDVILRDICVESPFVHPGIMTRTAVIKQLGGYRERGWPEDYDLWLRMATAGCRFARLPQKLFFWRDHLERATRTLDDYSNSAFRKCKFSYLQQGFLDKCPDVVIAGSGIEGRAWHRLVVDAGINVSNWLDVDPRKTGRILHNAEICLPDNFNLSNRKMLVAIGVHGARILFRDLATNCNWVEGKDFVCVS